VGDKHAASFTNPLLGMLQYHHSFSPALPAAGCVNTFIYLMGMSALAPAAQLALQVQSPFDKAMFFNCCTFHTRVVCIYWLRL